MIGSIYSILKNMIPTGFDTRVSLYQVQLAQFKSLLLVERRSIVLSTFVKEIISYARKIEVSNKRAEVELLNELNYIQSVFLSLKTLTLKALKASNLFYRTKEYKTSKRFIAIIIQAGLYLYIEHKVDRKPLFQLKPKEKLLLTIAL